MAHAPGAAAEAASLLQTAERRGSRRKRSSLLHKRARQGCAQKRRGRDEPGLRAPPCRLPLSGEYGDHMRGDGPTTSWASSCQPTLKKVSGRLSVNFLLALGPHLGRVETPSAVQSGVRGRRRWEVAIDADRTTTRTCVLRALDGNACDNGNPLAASSVRAP